jgi:sulfoxide reductase catalytic subunit YedY
MRHRIPEPKGSEITPEPFYMRRREFIKNIILFAGTATGVGAALVSLTGGKRPEKTQPALAPGDEPRFTYIRSPYSTDEPQTSYNDVTTYNNFYEFGTDKSDPARNAYTLKPRPWTVAIEGEVAKPQVVDVDTLMSWFPLEERIDPMRYVEAWSMVIPWLGFPLGRMPRCPSFYLARENGSEGTAGFFRDPRHRFHLACPECFPDTCKEESG